MPATPTSEEVKRLVSLFKDGRMAELEPLAARFSQEHPTHGLGWMLLAAICKAARRHQEALTAQLKAIEVMPPRPELFSNLGNIQLALDRLADAETSYRKCLQLDPDHVDGNFNFGVLLLKTARPEESERHLRRALRFEPDSPDIVLQTALSRLEQRQYSDAVVLLQKALALRPDYPEAHDNLNSAYLNLCQLDMAIRSGRAAVDLDPQCPGYLGHLLFTLNYADDDSQAAMDLARSYGRLVSGKAGAQRMSQWNTARAPRKLRIGFVSGDFKNHPVTLFLSSLLDHIDNEHFECFAYSTIAFEDVYTQRIKANFRSWNVLSTTSDAEAARQIHADGIHILIDLAGHTAHGRLPVFAYKPAPVQITWLGYFSTTGLPEMDYVLADEMGVPQSQSDRFTEAVWRLPHTRLCFAPSALAPEVSPLPALDNGYFTFGCYQNASKVNARVLACWASIFQAVPLARLRWQSPQFADPEVRNSMATRLRDHGIVESRFQLLKSVDEPAYLSSYRRVDMVLDTFPFPGGTTTCEALWMGVPTLTLAGSSLLSRQGASLMAAAGLSNWIAHDLEEYQQKAVDFSADTATLALLRANLRARLGKTPLFDGPAFARDFEAAMLEIWQRSAPASPG
jgi:predicted O-linked N-acetylglucosamine transferase (SPINDLY family)